MGFYLRKSLTVGPFRFNLSKSGIGVSAGVKGLRVGVGPRGNYIHAGAHGIYYRASFGGGQGERGRHSANGGGAPARGPVVKSAEGLGSTTVFASEDATVMAAANPDTLVDEIRAKAGFYSIWLLHIPPVLLSVLLLLVHPGWLTLCAVIALLVITTRASARDRLARTTVMMYELEEEYEEAYRELVKAFEQLFSCRSAWVVNTMTQVLDRKRNAGAGRAVTVSPTWLRDWSPWWLMTNVPTPAIGMGRQAIMFLPDRALVISGKAAAAVRYQDLSVELEQVSFIEAERPPSDGTVVGRTWAFVNKSGGPDRRYKHNPEFPILQYSRIRFGAVGGLDLLIQLSKADLGHDLKVAMSRLGKAAIAMECGPNEVGASPGTSPVDPGRPPRPEAPWERSPWLYPRWGELWLTLVSMGAVACMWMLAATDAVAKYRLKPLTQATETESLRAAAIRNEEMRRRGIGPLFAPLAAGTSGAAMSAPTTSAGSSSQVERIEWVENETQRIKIKYSGDQEIGRWVFWKK